MLHRPQQLYGTRRLSPLLGRGEETPVISLVQPYGGLVEYVQDTDEAASYLRSEPYPLGFTARERPRGTAQGEVSEPNVDEETEALPDLFDNPLADDPLPSGELHAVEETLRVCNGKLCELVDVVAADGHSQGFGPEPGAPALGAGDVAHELFDLLPPVLRVGLGVAPLQVADDAVEAGHILPAAVVAGGGRKGKARPLCGAKGEGAV